MELVELGRARTAADGCRRYRPLATDFDTRAVLLEVVIEENWTTEMKAQWTDNQESVREGLLAQYGVVGGQRKIADFVALGPAPMSVVASHRPLLEQIRSAFVSGAYYPALVGASALGERILNQLMLTLRDDFEDHPATAKIKNKESSDNWKRLIGVLRDWGVLSEDEAVQYLRLEKLRHRAVHYGEPSLDSSSREESLEAVRLLQDIIRELFSSFGGKHFIPGTRGSAYVKLEAEHLPFVRHFLLPASALVSPAHKLEFQDNNFIAWDDPTYGHAEGVTTLTDEEFAARIAEGLSPPLGR